MSVLFENALIALGSNLNAPRFQVRQALTHLANHEAIELRGYSRLFETAPEGYIEQPKFINAVCWIQTTLTPESLLDAMMAIEKQMGRTRDPEIRFGPRVIDLDLLLFATERLDTPFLTLPHPRMHERVFVLDPLSDLIVQHPHLKEWVDSQMKTPSLT